MAGVALGDIDRHFAWQAWHLATSTCILRGKRGTYGIELARVAGVALESLCVAGMAIGDMGVRFAWPLMPLGCLWWCAWFPFGAVVAAAVCMAGVALGDMDFQLAWQAWHLKTCAWQPCVPLMPLGCL